MDTTTRLFLYARKSTDESDRQVLSIEAQLFELRELAKREGWTIVREFIESRTAKQPGRPIFNEMIAAIEKGEAAGIIAWHPDRLARNSVDGGRIIYLVDTGKIQMLRFPTFHFETTAHGKFMLSIAFSQSKYYVDNLSENIKRGIRQKLRNGIWPSWAPVGYLNDRAGRCIVVEENKAPLIRKAFEMYATGDVSLATVRETINGLGLTGRKDLTLSVKDYHVILQNPVYYGMIRYKGELYEGKHDPIISKRLFDQVQLALSKRSKPKTPGLKPYRYRGMFNCGECGCVITAETQKGHNYLRCTKRRVPCHQRYVREESVDGQIAAAIGNVSIRTDWADRMLAELAGEQGAQQAKVKKAEESLTAEFADCEARLDELLDMALAKSISQEEYKSKKAVLLKRKVEIREELTNLTDKSRERFEPLTEFVKEAKQAVFLARERNPDACRDFLKKHGSNCLLADGQLRIEFQNPWKSVAEFTSALVTASEINPRISDSSNWRREGDSNPR